MADLQFLTEDLELLDACEGTLDVDYVDAQAMSRQAGNVGGVLGLFFGKIVLPRRRCAPSRAAQASAALSAPKEETMKYAAGSDHRVVKRILAQAHQKCS